MMLIFTVPVKVSYSSLLCFLHWNNMMFS